MATAGGGAADALSFCRASPTAVVVTVWPTAHAVAGEVRAWLSSCGARVLLEREVSIASRGGVATCMALYYGEDWVHTNCWYGESPLPTGRPAGPYAGAKWKAALTFACEAPMTVFVVDAEGTDDALWRGKYGIRDKLRRAVPNALGNCCMHLTDDQADALAAWQGGGAGGGGGGGTGGGGYECDSSFAFHCARVLLTDSSANFLNSADHESPKFEGTPPHPTSARKAC